MAKVIATVVVYTRLIAQYGNFRLQTLQNGDEIKIPSIYNLAVFEFPPTSIELPPMDFEYFNDNIDEILEIMQYNDQYLKLKQYLNNVDTTKISMPDTIPVSEVPIEYVSYRNNTPTKNVITPNGIFESNHDPFDIRGIDDDDIDDDISFDDDDSDDIHVEHVVRFVSPNFIYQTMNWATAIDIGSFKFISDRPNPIPDKVKMQATPIERILQKLGLKA